MQAMLKFLLTLEAPLMLLFPSFQHFLDSFMLKRGWNSRPHTGSLSVWRAHTHWLHMVERFMGEGKFITFLHVL